MIEIHQLTLKELDQATDTIFQAFKKDPMMLYIFGGIEGYEQNAEFAIKTWVKWAILYGLAISTPNHEGIALRKRPGKLNFSFWSMLRTGMLSYYKVLGKEPMQRLISLGKVLEAEQKKNMGTQKFWYCWIMAVHPENQGQGYGKALMNYTFNVATADNLPCYLETTTANNLQVHTHNGYELLSETKIPNSEVTIYSLLRK